MTFAETWAEACDQAKIRLPAVEWADDEYLHHAALELCDNLAGMVREQMGVACRRCCGIGSRCYASTATWRGGIGGCAMTTDVCDVCWGTGRTDQTGPNLRDIAGKLRHYEALKAKETP